MANYIKKLFNNYNNVNVKIYSINKIKKMGLNLLYSVGNGTYNSPYFVIVERLINNKSPICILGKGITFDSGGINIKTTSKCNKSVYYMKCDKLGACYGVYALKHIIETDNKKSIVGIFPFTENILTNRSLKSGDVIKSYSKKNVEIVDTDAEGRLILADSLSYCKKYNPTMIIDISTLTETYITCESHGTFFTLNKKLKNHIENISYKFNEKIAGLPCWVEKKSLYSTVADIKNYTLGCKAGSFMGAMFLHEFVPNTKNWVHFDISNELYEKDEIQIPNGKVIRTIIEIIKK